MHGAFVSNAFLDGGKFSEPGRMMMAAAERAGVELAAFSNADLAAPIGGAELLSDRMGDVGFVIFWDKDVALAANLELCGYAVFDSSECIRVCDDKALTHLALARAGVRSVETVPCPMSFGGYGDLRFADEAAARLGYPVVVKDRAGSFGMQVRLARGPDELRALLSPYRPCILQKYVECSGVDRRIEVVGGSVVAAMERRAAPGEFRSNATLGGSVSACVPEAEESELAVAACEAVGADFAGVDVIRTPDGPAVCEVNSNAHLRNLADCTGVDASDAIMRHILRKVGR